ncbi:MAG: hypothetical protein P8011_05350 [Acidihalobacter sp.]
MKNLILLFFVSLIASCASIPNSENSPYTTYQSFTKSLEAKNFKKSVLFLSKPNRDRFEKMNEAENFDNFFPFFSSTNTVISKELNHFQKIHNSQACLTIIGFDKKNEPTSINLKLIYEKNSWKFSFVHIFYYKSKSEFPTHAACQNPPQE